MRMAQTNGLVKWNAELVTGKARAKVEANMVLTLFFLEGKAKRKLSVRNEPRVRVGRSGMRGLNPSAPGDAPKLVTGTLRANVGSAVVTTNEEVIGFLGILKGPAESYGRRLELGMTGTDSAGRHINQAARPFLRPTVVENQREAFQRLIR